jgi:hypothetical protein
MDSARSEFVLGQRYTFATLALVVALLSFVNLAGLEKACLATVLGINALKRSPEPPLGPRRIWARFAIAVALAHALVVTGVVLLNLHRIPKVLEALRALSEFK